MLRAESKDEREKIKMNHENQGSDATLLIGTTRPIEFWDEVLRICTSLVQIINGLALDKMKQVNFYTSFGIR